MAQRSSDNFDKFIVDRRKTRRNDDVTRTVRQTRDKLAIETTTDGFGPELLRLHASTVVSSFLAIVILVVMVGLIGHRAGMGTPVIVWCVFALCCYLALLAYSRRVQLTDDSRLQPTRSRNYFLALHAMTGLAWMYYGYLDCEPCTIQQFSAVKAVILLITIGASAVITAHLNGALLITFVGALASYILSNGAQPQPLELVMTSLLAIALAFFTYIAGRMYRSTVTVLSFRTEKDGLIAELETAKSLSDEARRRAEEANLAKSRFLASMSHELRTPLNAILGFSEVMANEVLGPMSSPSYREYARDIHDSGEHLLDLINEILDLSRIEAGRYQMNEEAISLLDTVEECCHLMELRARGKKIRITQIFEQGLPRIFADERAMRQIGLNLLTNAVKFTPTGGEVEVRVGWTAGGGQYVAVKDNGPGIAEDEIPVVLSAFGQGSIAIKSAEQGTGLGLPIVQGLVALHGGEFKLTSELRQGTEAIVMLPASRVVRGKFELPKPKAGKTAAR